MLFIFPALYYSDSYSYILTMHVSHYLNISVGYLIIGVFFPLFILNLLKYPEMISFVFTLNISK